MLDRGTTAEEEEEEEDIHSTQANLLIALLWKKEEGEGLLRQQVQVD